MRRVRLLAISLVVLALACPLAAQTHPCELPDVTAGTAVAGAPLTLSACHNGKDANGNPDTLTGWALYDNGARTTLTLMASGAPSPVSGQTLYTTTITAPAAASVHTYQLAAIDARGEGGKSSPFVLTVSLPLTVPSAPSKLRLQ